MNSDMPRYGIPKLLRVHFANVGHAVSRLDPLTLPFYHQTGAGLEPVHATIWAENGVGKTSIRSLLFSILEPDVHRVMKSANAGGGNRKYEGFFFRGHDHAVILMEWIFDDIQQGLPGMENFGGYRRILGMTATWSPRAAGLAVDKRPLGELERTYFSFTPNQGVQWDILPVKGLASGGTDHCKTGKELLEWLRTHRQTIDFKTFQTQSSWREHLEQLGLDPKLFDNQLAMAGSGGAIQVFKNRIRSPRDFVRFYLESTLPEEMGKDLVELLLQDRKIILERDKHAAGLEYLRVVQHPLDAFAATVREYREAKAALEQAQQEAGRMAGLLQTLAQQVSDATEEVKAKQTTTREQQGRDEAERTRLRDYLRVLEHQTAKLTLVERQTKVVELAQRLQAAERKVALTEVHGKWRDVKTAEDELAPVEEQCRKLEAKEQDLLGDLRVAGATWLARLQDEVQDLTAQQNAARGDLAAVQDLLAGLSREREEAQNQQARLEAEIAQLRTTLGKAAESRCLLASVGVLCQDEDPRQAKERHANRRKQAEEHIAIHTGVVRSLEAKLQTLRAQEKPLEGDRARALKALQDAEVALRDAQGEQERLQNLPSLCWALDVNALALADAELLESLGAAIQTRAGQRDDLAAQLAELRRRLKPLNDAESGLLAPPVDTGKAHTALHDLGVRVFTAGTWLDRNCTPEKAKQAITADPARYTGLMVPDVKELERVRSLGASIKGLDHPVMVSIVGLDDGAPSRSDRIVLPPEHPATYNRKAAQQMAQRLRHEVIEREGELVRLTRQLEDARRDQVILSQHIHRFPRGNLGGLTEAVATAKSTLVACEQAITDNHNAIHTHEGELRERQTELADMTNQAQECREQERQIHEWLLRYGETLDNLRLPKAEAELAVAQDAIDEKRRAETPLKVEEETYRNRIADLGARLHTIELAKNEIPNDHRQGQAQDWAMARAKAAYHDVKIRLESAQTEESLALFAKRDERRKAVNKAKAELDRYCTSRRVDPNLAIRLKIPISYDEAVLQAGRELEEATRKHNVAEHEVQQAQELVSQHPMPLGYREHPSDAKPRNAEHGRGLMADTQARIEHYEQQIRKAEGTLQELDRRQLILEGQRKEVANLQRDWREEGEVAPLPWVTKVPSVEKGLETARDALEGCRRARRRFTSAKETRDSAYQEVDRESRNRNWDLVDTDKRRAVQQGADTLTSIVETVLQEYRTWREVITDSLERAEAAVGQITDRLTTLVKSDGLAVIHHAQIGSRLPDSTGEWSDRPFLKMELSNADTRSLTAADVEPYCKQVVRQLLSDEQPFDGRELIVRVLDQLAGADGYRVTILKPSHTLSSDRHSITELASWSDGEIITTAIILYCCVVQARTWHRTGAGRTMRQQSNGILLLDNPFGEANSPDFVQLQVDMAKKLGVQLIYTASGDPRELLAMFRRNNRLYQRSGNGVKHVNVEDVPAYEHRVARGTVALKHG